MLWTEILLRVGGEVVPSGDSPLRRETILEFLATGRMARGEFGSSTDQTGRTLREWEQPDWDQSRVDYEYCRGAMDCAGLVPATPAQVRAAHSLACAFGHGWARVCPEECDHDVVKIREATRSTRSEFDRFGEIEAPHVCGDGTIRHATTSGRLNWAIGTETVSISVYRPDGEVLTATVSIDGSEVALTVPEDHPKIWRRHCAALSEAIKAVAPQSKLSDTDEVVSALRAKGIDVAIEPQQSVAV